MSRPDRDGITLLVLIILVALILFHYASPEKEEEATASIPATATTTTPSTSTTFSSAGNPLPQKVRGEVPGGLTPFDPNSADSATLLSVGLRPWQVRNIMRYRARGGRYRLKEDFAQLYGLTLEQYRTLEPYIRIKPQVMAADVIKRPKRNYQPRSASSSRSSSSASRSSSKLSPGQTVDANTADTTELKRIPGIGSYFARRIISLRRQRQQFQSKEELLSIRNFPESALSYITLSHNYPPILINSMTQKELERHPLLNYLQARDIIRLRTNTGRINNLDDLSLLPSFTPQHLKIISSYIEY